MKGCLFFAIFSKPFLDSINAFNEGDGCKEIMERETTHGGKAYTLSFSA